MTTPTERTIKLKGYGVVKEAVTVTDIVPGMLIMLDSAGKAKPHNVAGGRTTPNFALEQETIGLGVDDSYLATQNDQCVYASLCSGAEVYALVAASAAAIVVGDNLESAGDGTLRKVTIPTQLTGLAGTPAQALTAVSHIALSTAGGNTYTDAAVNTAVNTALDALQQEIQDLYTQLNLLFTARFVYHPIAVALSAIDNSGNGSSRARVIAEVM